MPILYSTIIGIIVTYGYMTNNRPTIVVVDNKANMVLLADVAE